MRGIVTFTRWLLCMERRSIVLLAIVLFQTGIAFVQDKETIQFDHADSLVSRIVNNQETLDLIGNVKMSQGDAFIQCEAAQWFRKADLVLLTGSVLIFDGSRTLIADRVRYEGKTRTETATGHVFFLDGERLLICEHLIYQQKKKNASAYTHVILKDFENLFTLRCKHLFYDETSEYAVATGDPFIIKTDSTSQDTLMIDGEKIELWAEENRMVVTDSVELAKGQLKAECQSAEYWSDQHQLILNSKPMVELKDQRMRAEQIVLDLKDLQFHGAVLTGSPEIISVDSTLENKISGQSIRIEARQDTVLRILVTGQASSTYHILEEDRDPGINVVTGDAMTLYFEDNEIERVFVVSAPGQCEGTYKPMQMKGKRDAPVPEKYP